MRGIALNEQRELTMMEFPVPELGEDMVRIRTKFAGVCGTDVSYWRAGSSKLRLPVILGHEMSGVITEVGKQVTDFRVGDRVLVTNDYYLCGECRYCRSGRTNMCMKRRSIGSAEQGAFTEYMTVPAKMVLHLADSLSFKEGALAEVAACGVHALHSLAGVKAGDVVLVLGPGIMGMTAALAAKALGCTVVVAGLARDAGRLQVAREQGIPYVVNTEETDLKALLLQISEGYGPSVVCECTGSFGGLSTCLDLVAKCGTVMQIAIPHGAHGIDLSPVILKELRYMGSYAKLPADWALTLQLMEEGRLKLSPLVSAVYSPDEYLEAFERTAAAKDFKIMLDMETI